MTIETTGTNLALTPAVKEHVLRRATIATARFARRVGRVLVRLSDRNGPRGGEDKVCRIETTLDGRGTVVVEAVDRDPYVAVDKATTTLKLAVTRRIERLKGQRAPAA